MNGYWYFVESQAETESPSFRSMETPGIEIASKQTLWVLLRTGFRPLGTWQACWFETQNTALGGC